MPQYRPRAHHALRQIKAGGRCSSGSPSGWALSGDVGDHPPDVLPRDPTPRRVTRNVPSPPGKTWPGGRAPLEIETVSNPGSGRKRGSDGTPALPRSKQPARECGWIWFSTSLTNYIHHRRRLDQELNAIIMLASHPRGKGCESLTAKCKFDRLALSIPEAPPDNCSEGSCGPQPRNAMSAWVPFLLSADLHSIVHPLGSTTAIRAVPGRGSVVRPT